MQTTEQLIQKYKDEMEKMMNAARVAERVVPNEARESAVPAAESVNESEAVVNELGTETTSNGNEAILREAVTENSANGDEITSEESGTEETVNENGAAIGEPKAESPGEYTDDSAEYVLPEESLQEEVINEETTENQVNEPESQSQTVITENDIINSNDTFKAEENNNISDVIEKILSDNQDIVTSNDYPDSPTGETLEEIVVRTCIRGGEKAHYSPPANTFREPDTNTNFPLNDTGFLQVEVFAANRAFPIQGAVVRIKSADENELVSVLVSDKDGLTQKIEMPAPDRQLSKSPQYPNPYAIYIVDVSADEYIPQLNRRVQILGGIESTLPSNLIPE